MYSYRSVWNGGNMVFETDEESKSEKPRDSERAEERQIIIVDLPVDVHEKVVPIFKALLEILKLSSGTVPLRLFKELAPLGTSLMMAHMGEDVMASATIVNAFEDFTSMVGNSPLFFVATAVGELQKKEKRQEVGREAQAGWISALFCGSPQVVAVLIAGPVLKMFAQPRAIVTLTDEFFKCYVYAIPALSLNMVSEQVAQASHKLYSPVIVQIFGLGGMLFFSYALSFGKFGLPNLGIRGPALALTGKAIFTLASFNGYVFLSDRFGGSFKELKLFSRQKGIARSLKRYAINGIPLFIVFFSEVGGIFLTNLWVGRLGDLALSAQLVVSRYQSLQLVVTNGLSSAAQIGVSNAVKQRPKSARRYGNTSIVLSAIFPSIQLILAFAVPRLLVMPFVDVNDPQQHDLVNILADQKLLAVSSGALLLNSLSTSCAQSLLGESVIFQPMLFNFLATGVGVISAYLLCFEADFGVVGISGGLLLGQALGAASNYLYWRHSMNSKISEADPHAKPKWRWMPSFFKKRKHGSIDIENVSTATEETCLIVKAEKRMDGSING